MERQPGQEIVRQGSVGDELFILGRGEVEVVVADEDGQERVVNVLGEGDFFGEISFLRRTPRTATVRARTLTELHVLRRLDFDHLLEHLGEGDAGPDGRDGPGADRRHQVQAGRAVGLRSRRRSGFAVPNSTKMSPSDRDERRPSTPPTHDDADQPRRAPDTRRAASLLRGPGISGPPRVCWTRPSWPSCAPPWPTCSRPRRA